MIQWRVFDPLLELCLLALPVKTTTTTISCRSPRFVAFQWRDRYP